MTRGEVYCNDHHAILLLQPLENGWWHGQTDGHCDNTIVSAKTLRDGYKHTISLTDEQIEERYSHVKAWDRQEALKELGKQLVKDASR